MYNIIIEEYDLNNRQEIEKFLSPFELELEDDVEYTLVARKKGEIIGSCSSSGNIIKSLAVRCTCSDSGIGSRLVTKMMNILFDKGIYDVFVFTKKVNTLIFNDLGFKEVVSTEKVILMEIGRTGEEEYIAGMFSRSGMNDKEKAAIVMNCNPITLGHMHLIRKVSEENNQVVIFIVQEERSLFPFETRIDLVRKCTQHLNNVHVIPGGRYIISSNTFPTYFLREEDKSGEYISIDLEIFARYIAPTFNIVKRYVGTEPYCNLTESYNKGMKRILPKYGIEVVELNRLEQSGEAISASRVRQLIKENNIEKLKDIVCSYVYEYLLSEDAYTLIDKIRRSDSRH